MASPSLNNIIENILNINAITTFLFPERGWSISKLCPKPTILKNIVYLNRAYFTYANRLRFTQSPMMNLIGIIVIAPSKNLDFFHFDTSNRLKALNLLSLEIS